jgi:excisionase family DNA binding protein
MTRIEPETLYTVREVATLLRVDQTTVRRWIRDDRTLVAIELPHKGTRQSYRVRGATLLELFAPAKEVSA